MLGTLDLAIFVADIEINEEETSRGREDRSKVEKNKKKEKEVLKSGEKRKRA